MNTKTMKMNTITVQTRDVTTQQKETTCRVPWINNEAHGHGQTCRPGNEKVTFPQNCAYTRQ